MVRKLMITLVAVLALTALVAPVSAQSIGMMPVRFVHAAPGVAAVDIYIDNDLVVAGATYGTATPHLSLPLGEHVMMLNAAGAGPTGAEIFSSKMMLTELRDGLQQTAIIQPGSNGSPEVIMTEDDLNSAQLGQARLHVIHANVDIGTVDLIGKTGAPIAQGLNFNTPSGTVNPPVSSWDLAVVSNGGTLDDMLLDVGELNFNTNLLYTVILIGTASDPDVMVLSTPLQADPGSDVVMTSVAHGSSDAPAVDIYADETKLFVGVQPGDVLPHVPLLTGDLTLTVREAGAEANSDPVASSRINLSSSTGAATVVAMGALGDNTFTFSIYEDSVAGLASNISRVRVINTVQAGPASVTLSDGQALSDGLPVFAASDAADIAPGHYSALASITGEGGALALELPEQQFNGGSYNTLLLYANAEAGVSFNTTALNLAIDSLPGAQQGVIAVSNADTSPPSDETTDTSTETTETTSDSATDTTSTETDTSEAPPSTPPPAVSTGPGPSSGGAPQLDTVVRATVNINPGSNLQCREYPSADARSLGLIPNATSLEVRGYAGPADPELDTPYVPVDPELFEDPLAAEDWDEIWVSAYWLPPEGGTIDCWVRADFLIITYRNRYLREPTDLFALEEIELPLPIIQMIPFNYPAQPVDTVITPPTPVQNDPIATVNVNPGSNLHLRRMPDADTESLALVPSGADLLILARTPIIGEDVGDEDEGDETPVVPDIAWLYVEYTDTISGLIATGWISSQYVILSQGGRSLELEEIPVAEFILPGEVLSTGAPGTAPASGAGGTSAPVTGTINIPEGSNLNMYDIPSTTGTLLRSLTAGTTVTVLGRNGDGTWLNVRYEALGEGVWLGWVNNAGGWVTVPVPIRDLPITNGDPDTMP